PPVPPCPEGAGGPNVTAEDVKNAATKAAAAFSDSVKASAAAAAEFIKTKRDERAAGEEPVDAEVEEPAEEPTEDEAEEAAAPAEETAEAETEDEDAEEEAEEAPAEEPEDEAEEDANDEEKVKLNTGAVRSAAKKAGEAVANTAKAGVSLGKLGLTKGRDALSALFPQKDEPETEAEEPVSEEPTAEEAPADEEETKTEE
ncbi:MAG: hypothetical protein LUG64_08760, partial [Clostridiales bacterium]|nr:hypothetical protein [Clostridiales bacterium]